MRKKLPPALAGFLAGLAAGFLLGTSARRPPSDVRPGDSGSLIAAEPGAAGGSAHRVLVVRVSGGGQIPLPDDRPRRAWTLRVGDRHWSFVEVAE